MKALVFISTLFQLLVPCSAAIKQCYYPDGSASASDFPCDPNAKQSPCCGGGLGTACLSNRLCQGNDGNIVRGSCSDRNWSSPECANYCLGASTGGTDLISCSNVTNTNTSYCCDHTNDCCDLASVDSMFYQNSHNPATTTTTSTTATSTTATFTTSATRITTSTSPTNSSLNQSNQSSGLSTGAKAGIGVGVGVGATLIAAIAFLVWKLRQRNTSTRTAVQAPIQELDGRRHTITELDARGKLNQELRPPAELSG